MRKRALVLFLQFFVLSYHVEDALCLSIETQIPSLSAIEVWNQFLMFDVAKFAMSADHLNRVDGPAKVGRHSYDIWLLRYFAAG